MPFPTTLQYINEAEQQLGVLFPESFRSHLLKSNGGEVEYEDDSWEIFPVFDKSDRKRMARTANHIVNETRQARSWSGFPPNAVAFCSNGTGDRLVFIPDQSTAQQLSNTVYLWDHETAQTIVVAEDFAKL
jgi:dipeptidyl aminopeptidase/acylaminoacyl peptidase